MTLRRVIRADFLNKTVIIVTDIRSRDGENRTMDLTGLKHDTAQILDHETDRLNSIHSLLGRGDVRHDWIYKLVGMRFESLPSVDRPE